MNQKKTLTLVGVVAILATAGTLLFAADPKEKTEGKFHLLYRVIAPKVEVGAEVEIEPALITDGNRIYFAWDFCRWHYPERNYDPKARYNVKEDRLDRKLVSAADQADLQRYCRHETYKIRGSEFLAIDNDGVQVSLIEATFVPIHNDSSVPGGIVPDRFTASIARMVGTPKPKLSMAAADNQPYVFLMSRNHVFLENMVMRAAMPRPEEAVSLLARLERYKERRRVSDQSGINEECAMYWPQRRGLHARSGKPLELVELFYYDLDGDGKQDLVARFIEDSKWLAMARVLNSGGSERCLLRNGDGNRNSPIYRPLTYLKMRSCIYIFTQTSTEDARNKTGNANMNLIPLVGVPERCRVSESYRNYEPT